MAIAIQWFARFIDSGSAPVAGLSVDFQMFNLASAVWETQQSVTTDGDGRIKGQAAINDDTLPFAPATRMVETGSNVVLSTTPQVVRSGTPPSLKIDFGELTHLPVETRVAPVTAMGRVLRANAFTVGAINPAFARGAALDVATDATRAAPAPAPVDVGVLKASITDEVRAGFAKRLADSDRIVADRDTALAARVRDVADRDAQIGTISNQLQIMTAENERLRTAAAAAAAGAATAAGAKPQALPVAPVAMANFATSIGDDLHAAQSTLATRAFSIGRFEVNAKALIGNNATLQLPDPDSKVDPGKLSDVKIEFQADAGSAQDLGLKVPDVAQLTETAARRVLNSVGLQLQVSYGPSSIAPGSAPGQAMVQTPGAGESASRGARVLVVFAANDGE